MGCWKMVRSARARGAEQRPRYATSGGRRLVMHCRRLGGWTLMFLFSEQTLICIFIGQYFQYSFIYSVHFLQNGYENHLSYWAWSTIIVLFMYR